MVATYLPALPQVREGCPNTQIFNNMVLRDRNKRIWSVVTMVGARIMVNLRTQRHRDTERWAVFRLRDMGDCGFNLFKSGKFD